MGRLETQQRGDNVCILKGWNAILQQAASGYEMNNDIATTVGLNLNITNFELLWTLQLGWDLELFEPKFIHQNANLAPLHWDFLHWMFQHLNFLNEKLKNNNFTCNLVNAGHWLLGWPKQL